MAVAFKPRASSRAPIQAVVSPLPIDETTPPVTKMYLVGRDSIKRSLIFTDFILQISIACMEG